MLKTKEALKWTFIALIGSIIVLTAYFSFKLNQRTEGSGLVKEEPLGSFFGSRYRDFESEDLGVAFTYPASWGELTQWVGNPPEDRDGFRMEATISSYDTPFISMISEGEAMGRGGWWGDIAALATDADTVETFCDTYRSRTEYYVQPEEACEILINENDVTFARLSGDTVWFDWVIEDTYVYIAFHPNHTFYGLALSAQSLRRTELEETIGNAEKAIQEIANSLSFTETTP